MTKQNKTFYSGEPLDRIVIKEKTLFFIPEYILNGLHSKNLYFDKFTNIIDTTIIKNKHTPVEWYNTMTENPPTGDADIDSVKSLISNRDDRDLIDILEDNLRPYLSKYDFGDIYGANIFCGKSFNIKEHTYWWLANNADYDRLTNNESRYSDNTTKLIETLVDKSIDLESIMMSSINSDVDVPFELRTSETCIYIILQNGFFNYLTFNINNFKDYFLKILFTYFFKTSNRDYVFDTGFFKKINLIIYSKYFI